MTYKKKSFNAVRARRLGVVSSIVCALAGWIFLLKDIPGAFFFSFFAVLLLTVGLLKPSLLKIPSLLWHNFVVIFFDLILKGLLILLFFLIVTPLGLVARLLGKDVFSEKIFCKTTNYWNKTPGSYWVSKQKTNVNTMRW